MFSLLAGLWQYLFAKPEYYVLILGLDAAGKTTMLERMKTVFLGQGHGLPPDRIVPTVGQNIGRLEIGRYKLTFWDLGGQVGLRSLWEKYFAETHAVVYVVDAADRTRLAESRAAFDALLEDVGLLGVPVLLLANKQDLPGALPSSDIEELFDLRQLRSQRQVDVVPASAITGDGLQGGIEWLVKQLASPSRSSVGGSTTAATASAATAAAATTSSTTTTTTTSATTSATTAAVPPSPLAAALPSSPQSPLSPSMSNGPMPASASITVTAYSVQSPSGGGRRGDGGDGDGGDGGVITETVFSATASSSPLRSGGAAHRAAAAAAAAASGGKISPELSTSPVGGGGGGSSGQHHHHHHHHHPQHFSHLSAPSLARSSSPSRSGSGASGGAGHS